MAASGYTPILIYASATASNVPLAVNLTSTPTGAELALNYADGKLYFKNSSGTVTLLASSTTVTNTFSAGTTGLTPNTPTAGPVTLSGTLNVANGGTGSNTLTANNVLLGNGTSAVQEVAPGTAGNLLTSTGTTWSSQAPAPGVLTGTIAMWPTASAPAGYLLCNGQQVSTSTYAALFAVIGTTFGSGSGTFALPNYTNYMPIGAGGTYGLATTGGSATTTLSTTNLPAHNHSASVTDPGRYHNSYNNGATNGGGAGAALTYGGNSPGLAVTTVSTGISVAIGNTGSGTAFNTISPYLAIYFIIKT